MLYQKGASRNSFSYVSQKNDSHKNQIVMISGSCWIRIFRGSPEELQLNIQSLHGVLENSPVDECTAGALKQITEEIKIAVRGHSHS